MSEFEGEDPTVHETEAYLWQERLDFIYPCADSFGKLMDSIHLIRGEDETRVMALKHGKRDSKRVDDIGG